MARASTNPAVDALVRRHRPHWAEALPWVLAVVVMLAMPEFMALWTHIAILILFALSLDLVLGYAGIITLGHAAFFGIGAYAAGLISAQHGWNEPLTGLMFAGTVAAALGFVAGLIILRTHGLTLLMLTLAITIMLAELANLEADYTGGFDGLFGMDMEPIFGFLSFDGTLLGTGVPFTGFEFNPLDFTNKYLYALIVLFILFAFARTLVHSPFGRSLVGIRERAPRMHAIGTPVHMRLVSIYTISAGMAGIAGGLMAQTEAFVTPHVFSFELSGEILIMLILGGKGRLYGAFVGVIAFEMLKDQLAKLDPQLWQFGVGLVLVLTVLFARKGLYGLAEDAWLMLRARYGRVPGTTETGAGERPA